MAFWDTVMDSTGDALYKRRLLPLIVDSIAELEPDRICFSFPQSASLQDGFRDVSFQTFARAINKTAHFIHREIGRSSMFETVMYMGHADIRYFIALIALMKTGHKVLFSSHRNSVACHSHLIKQTDCTILLHTIGFPVSSILEKCRMESLCMPELDYLLDNSPCEPYPYTKTFDDAKNQPCLVVHTSGSTGLPRPVVWSHWSLAVPDSTPFVPPLLGRPEIWDPRIKVQRLFTDLVNFHGAGIATAITKACYNRMTIVVGAFGLATLDVLDYLLDYGNIDAINCTPTTLEELATKPRTLSQLHNLTYITYLGGFLSKEAGDTISGRVSLHTVMASTETNMLIQHVTDSEDWEYACINPTYNGIEMRPCGDLYELIFVRDSDYQDFQQVFKIFPQLREYSMGDLFSKHPTKPHHWKHESRMDELIVLENGRILSPRIHEQLINSHPAVQHCLIVGSGRKRPAVIIELQSEYYTEDHERQRSIISAIWPKIQAANEHVDDSIKLEPRYIILAKRQNPFSIAIKGTVHRQATTQMYQQAIERLYSEVASNR